MNKCKDNYDFCMGVDQRDLFTSVIESRLVPRDLSKFNSMTGKVEDAYIYVDDNGTPSKVSLLAVQNGLFPIVDEEPIATAEGQVIILKIGENEYKLEKADAEGKWTPLYLMSNADIINYVNTNAHLTSINVQDAIDELSNDLKDNYYDKSIIKPIAISGLSDDVIIDPISGMTNVTNLQEALELIWSKQVAGFDVLENAPKIQLTLDKSAELYKLSADVVSKSLGKEDFRDEVNLLLNKVEPDETRITNLEARANALESGKADQTNLDAATARISTNEEDIKSIKSLDKTQNTRLTNLETSVKSDESRITVNESDIKSIKELDTTQNNRLDKAESNIKTAQTDISTLQTNEKEYLRDLVFNSSDIDFKQLSRADGVKTMTATVTSVTPVELGKTLTLIKNLNTPVLENVTDAYITSTDEENKVINVNKEFIRIKDGTEESVTSNLLKLNSDNFSVGENGVINTKIDTSETEKKLKELDDKITTNKEAIATNTTNISTNKTAIEKNAGDISTNKDSITTNKEAIETEVARAKKQEADLFSYIGTQINNEKSKRVAADRELKQAIDDEATRADEEVAKEAETRASEDTKLQEQIDVINSHTDVVDVVGTHADLEAYDITKITINDIVKVLKDETRDNATTYYRLVDNEGTKEFSFVGEQGPFYTVAETDNKFVPKTTTVNGKALSDNITLAYSDITDLPTIGNATISIQKNGVTVDSFDLNDTTNKEISLDIPTKVSEVENDKNYIDKTVTVLDNFYDKSNIDSKVKTLNDSIDLKANQATTYTKTETDSNISTAVSAEATRAKEVEDSLKSTKQDKVNISSASDLYWTNEDKTDLEVSKYTAGNNVTILKDSITKDYTVTVTESTLDLTKNTALENRLDTINTNIIANKDAIAAEATRAKAVENQLTSDLSTEVTRAKEAESTLTNDLDTETTRAKEAESTLTNDLDTETTRAKEAEKANTDAIEQEVTDRKAAITSLSGTVSTNTSDVSGLKNKLSTAETNIASLETWQTSAKTQISDLQTATNKNKTDIATINDTELPKKVDKVDGYGLSKNDFTDILKAKLDGIAEGAEVNVQADWAETDNTKDSFILNKPEHLGNVDDVQVNGETVLSNRIANIDLTSYSKYSETGARIDLELDSTTYEITAKLYDKDDNLLSTSTVIDLPIEQLVVNVSYDESTKALTIELKNGTKTTIPLESIITGLATTTYVDTEVGKVQTSLTNEVTNRTNADATLKSTLQTNIDKKVDKVTGKSLLSDTEITRLSGMSTGANKTTKSTTNGNILIDNVETNVYTHPTQTAYTTGFYKITTDETGHVVSAIKVTKSDITDLGVPAQDTTYNAGEGIVLNDTTFKLKSANVAIESSAWTKDDTYGYYSAAVTLSGVTIDSVPTIDVAIAASEINNIDDINDAWSSVYSAITTTDTITFYSTDLIDRDLTLSVTGY